ncbi:cytochrome c [Winogradskyella jejuensis]|uniref:Cytochrome c, mono-and diheme variants n=1 Tax=Winogradskyella jejuensis TaxID=1089305 RepID=A0A1M5KR46_9FLAO|nr:cytochrome c [Winogradskyella jejuensis]SHG55274.1 Cytochrome c, mono-and diheme variants [Winogradskyella jejuensis]
MKTIQRLALLFTLGFLISCGGKEEKKERVNYGKKPKVETKKEEPKSDVVPASKRITLDNKGVGKIKNLELSATIDNAMVERGAALFKTNCTACHKTNKRFIGPNPTGIMERRSPEWIMNMILDPKLMTEEDQCAKDLLIEFNGAAMANQNLTEQQARDILEYFRTLK